MISVITITHNRIQFLAKAIQSVLEQDFSDFEYILVDDGSDEHIHDLVKKFDDPRIKYVYTSRLAHLPSLRNIGLNEAKGKIISFLDNDDLWAPAYLSKVYSAFNNPDNLSVISNAAISDRKKNKILFSSPASIQTSGNLLEQKLSNDKFVIYPSCFSYRNSSDTRFNTELKLGDNDLFMRVLASGNSVILPEPLVTITKHEENMSSLNTYDSPFIQSYFEELETLLFLKRAKKISDSVYRRAASKYYYKLAMNLAHLKMNHEARANFLNSFKTNPFRYKSLLRYFFS